MIKNKGLVYIIGSVVILGGGYLSQELLYILGGGYQMWDIISFFLFIIYSIVFFIGYLGSKKK